MALLDNTLNTFKYTQRFATVLCVWCEVVGDETCGKFKAHHVKNYPTHSLPTMKFLRGKTMSRKKGKRSRKKSQCHNILRCTVNRKRVCACGWKMGRRAESYLMSNKRIFTINKVFSFDLRAQGWELSIWESQQKLNRTTFLSLPFAIAISISVQLP